MAFAKERYKQVIASCSTTKVKFLLDYMYREGHRLVKLECIDVLSSELQKRGEQYTPPPM